MEESSNSAELSKYISKFLRENFGKGPESVHVSIKYTFITIYIRNFISPPEKVMMNQNKEQRVEEIRDLVITTLIPEIKANIFRITGMQVREFYYDWAMHNKSAMFTCVCTDDTKEESSLQSDFPGKKEMDKEIVHLSRIAQKKPEELESYQLNPRTYIFLRNGILVNIEKELIRDGLQENLKIAKRRLEKRLLHNNTHFEEILGMKVVEIFADWDFDIDKSVILFITNPTK
ncbi:Na-translocating system protein MpsC family protein [Aquibacillus kalidii]|uniref:Na-translocating system protein MpsC family protein n=1 Tax=Aquibacillus kalidii TaxID=2762597 RepID=UPI001647CFF1|nr:Na-translocating system protein MpsC family protein [Aquibacillus kalidii]